MIKQLKLHIEKQEKNLIILLLSFPLILLALGIYNGLMQTLYRSGMISQNGLGAIDYYQGLTLHGVINAIVLTTFFAVAFGHVCIRYYLKEKVNLKIAWFAAFLMIAGTITTTIPMLTGDASVLYTFYPPLKAHPAFYVGVVVLVVGTWLAFFGWLLSYKKWKAKNADEYVPLPVLATIVNFTVWFFCTLPAAYELIFMLIPWSMGFIETINIPLARTLFWFFGHALVYFWLLPAYTIYYAILPTIAGGKLYSENAGRLVFFLFLIFSIPVGVHHQFGEPAITRGMKLVQSILTYGVAIPSFMTAFTIAASLEYAAWKRKNGKTGLLSWMWHLPYFDSERYLFAYLICGLILFIFGGLTGLVNASYTLNSMVHNTAFIPGHFHMTVAGPVFLAIVGMSLYLIEKVTGKISRMRFTATIVPYLWMIGMFIFSSGLMYGGLIGEPRRTNLGLTYLNPESELFRPDWVVSTGVTLLGGLILTVAAGLFFLVLIDLILCKKKGESHLYFPKMETVHQEKKVAILNNFTPWIVVMLFIIVMAYVPVFRDIANFTGKGAKPYSPENPTPIEFNINNEEQLK